VDAGGGWTLANDAVCVKVDETAGSSLPERGTAADRATSEMDRRFFDIDENISGFFDEISV
jgi:hypothetical protein